MALLAVKRRVRVEGVVQRIRSGPASRELRLVEEGDAWPAVAVGALVLFPVEPYAAGVMIAAASLPVAGNVYMLAQHYGVAPQRVSASILISTGFSIVTVSAVIAWVSGF